jgi:hypothetical protein
MKTCKMIHVIQGILLPHYLHNVNLNNYGLSHVLKTITIWHLFTPKLLRNFYFNAHLIIITHYMAWDHPLD